MKKHLSALAALLCLLPAPAYAHGIYFDGGALLAVALVILGPGLLIALLLMRGNLRTRLNSAFAAFFLCLLLVPVLFVAFLLMGVAGLALGGVLTLLVALYMNRTKDGSPPTPQTVGKNFGNAFTNLLVIITLIVGAWYVFTKYKTYMTWLEIERDARNGKASAQRTMAWSAKSAEEALIWFRKAAEQGDALAQENLALRYRSGQGTPVDAKEALRWFLAAAPAKSHTVLSALADMYLNGEGTAKNPAEAIKWYLALAETSSTPYRAGIYVSIGRIYETGGDGLPADLVQAHYWFSRAAAGEYGSGAFEDLGRIKDKLTPEQLAQSRAMLDAAMANTPEPTSTRALMEEASDRMHNDNHDPLAPPNYAAAAPLLHKAADLGNAVAAARLCKMYIEALGVKQDFAEAYFWCLLSKQRYALAPQAYHDDENPVAMAQQARTLGALTDAQIADAERRLSEWKPVKDQP